MENVVWFLKMFLMKTFLVRHNWGWLVSHHGGGVDNLMDYRSNSDRGRSGHNSVHQAGPGGHMNSSGSSCTASSGSSTTKTLDETSSNGILEVGSSEHRHVVCGLLELEQHRQIFLGGANRGGDQTRDYCGLKKFR